MNKIIKKLYEEYLLTVAEGENEKEVQELAGKLEQLAEGLCEPLADYEEAARRAGFYAGYMAAVARLTGSEE